MRRQRIVFDKSSDQLHVLRMSRKQAVHAVFTRRQPQRPERRGAPVYLIALCAAREDLLPDLQGRLWLFGDEEESVYRHYYHEIRKNMAAGELLAARDAEIEQLKRQLSDRRTRGWRRWFRRG